MKAQSSNKSIRGKLDQLESERRRQILSPSNKESIENEKRRIKDRRLLQEYPDHALNIKLGKY